MRVLTAERCEKATDRSDVNALLVPTQSVDTVNLGQVVAEVGDLEATVLTEQRDQCQAAPVQ